MKMVRSSMAQRITCRFILNWVVLLCAVAAVPAPSIAQNLSTLFAAAARSISSYDQRGRHDVVLELVAQARGEIPSMKDHPVWLAIEAGQLAALGKYPEAVVAAETLLSYLSPKFHYPEDFGPAVKSLLLEEDDLKMIARLHKAKAHFRLDQREKGVTEAVQVEAKLKLWTGDINVHASSAMELALELADAGEAGLAESLMSRLERVTSIAQFSVAINPFENPMWSDYLKSLKDMIALNGSMIRGHSTFATGDFGAALGPYRKAHEISTAKLAPYHAAQLKVKARLMQTLNRLNRFDDVPALMPPDVYKDTGDSARPAVMTEMINIRAELGGALLALGRRPEAIAQWQRLVDDAEQQRGFSGLTSSQRQQQFSRWIPFYRLLAREYIRASDVAKAFEQVELSKSRLLLETITSGNADSSELLPQAQRVKLKTYTDRLGSIRNQALSTTDPAVSAQLQRQEANLAVELQTLRQQLFTEFPRYAAISRIAPATRGNPDLLPDGTVFISYMMVPNDVRDRTWQNVQVFAFVLRGDGRDPTAIDLGSFTDLDKLSAQYLTALVSSGDQARQAKIANEMTIKDPVSATEVSTPDAALKLDAEQLARQLSDRLIAPLLPSIGDARTLVFSADGPLALLPLETLKAGQQTLVQSFDVTYVQSLSVLALLKQRQKDYLTLDRRSLFAMGAAHYQTPKTAKAVTATPKISIDHESLRAAYLRDQGAVRVRSAVNRPVRLSNLPGTEVEIKGVSALFPDGAIYLKEDATESKLLELNAKNELANYRYLLFSAHGYLDTEVPELSALVLGQLKNPPGTDGFITAAKWPSYNIRSDLTVLSACETGTGKVIYGEGVMGLPYALYVAGNRSTALSLWEVDDEATAVFMKSFFGYLKAGKTPGEAINQTKREFLQLKRYASPFFWAPFVLYGI